jgi:nuclear pore complex protein Nup205
MAFLMTVAASKRGAEDLLDAGIFEQLSMCSFVSVPPMREEITGAPCRLMKHRSIAHGIGGALGDAVDRQHRVLVCALQLLVRVLSSLHRSSRTGAGHVSCRDLMILPSISADGIQAISFLNAHRESLLLILRENQQYLTLQGIEECKLFISILAMVVHKVPSDDLVSPTCTLFPLRRGEGSLNLALIEWLRRLPPRCFGVGCSILRLTDMGRYQRARQ